VVLQKPISAAAATLPTVAWQPEFQPQFLVLQGGTYYWATGDYQSGEAAGYIYSRPASAPSTDAGTRIVTVNQGNHGSIKGFIASTDALYWVTADANHAIRTTPLTGGTPTEVPGGTIVDYPYYDEAHLQVVGNTLYFVRNVGSSFLNGVYRYTPGDAAPTQLINAEDTLSLLVDATAIYYTAQNRVWKSPITGGAGVPLADIGGRIIGQDATFLYVTTSSCCNTTLNKVLK
jgi:hypothetical protein